jgi:hypothetical protein
MDYTPNISFYILLAFDGRYFFVPQHEVQSVEVIVDLQIATTDVGAIGWFGQNNESPVFCLNEDLALQLEIPETREYLVLLKAPEYPVGIVCDEVEDVNFQREHLYAQDLPPAMRTADSLIDKLLVYQDKIAYICHGEALVNHLGLLSERFMQSNSN